MYRCPWPGDDQLYVKYHDQEWGVPVRDSRLLLEGLILDGAQAGLSWITILRKREGYRAAFDSFDPERIAAYGEGDVARLLSDPGIVRNRLKILSAIRNARAYLQIETGRGEFADLVWSSVGGTPIQNRWESCSQIPVSSPESDALTRELKRRGFNFVGTTIVYAFMQAVGLVNDHEVACFRHAAVQEKAP